MTQTFTPWTPEQVDALNRWQVGPFHPFTCGSGNRMDAAHSAVQAKRGGDFGQLVATRDGWVCEACDYRQNWAHHFMIEWGVGAREGEARGRADGDLP